MAFELPLFDVAFKANADLSDVQYHLCVVDLSTDVSIGTATANTDTIVGVLQNKPGSAEAAQVRVLGISKVVAGAALTPGCLVTSDTSARASTIVGGSATIYTCGLTLDSTTGAGEMVSVLLTHQGRNG